MSGARREDRVVVVGVWVDEGESAVGGPWAALLVASLAGTERETGVGLDDTQRSQQAGAVAASSDVLVAASAEAAEADVVIARCRMLVVVTVELSRIEMVSGIKRVTPSSVRHSYDHRVSLEAAAEAAGLWVCSEALDYPSPGVAAAGEEEIVPAVDFAMLDPGGR